LQQGLPILQGAITGTAIIWKGDNSQKNQTNFMDGGGGDDEEAFVF